MAKSSRPPAKTPEGRMNQLIADAVDLAAKQIREGTASSQVITHFLKLGTQREKLELEILKEQRKLIQAKSEAIESAKNVEALYREAFAALKEYRGESDEKRD